LDNKGYYVGSVEEPAGKKGWLIGSFLEKNHLCFSEAVEVCWKKMGPDKREPKHIHKLAIEIWVIIEGSITAIIGDRHFILKAGTYVVVHPFTPTEILNAEEGTVVIGIKAPSIPEDKYPC